MSQQPNDVYEIEDRLTALGFNLNDVRAALKKTNFNEKAALEELKADAIRFVGKLTREEVDRQSVRGFISVLNTRIAA
jgi:DNA-binding transcriptional MerR regulator